MTIQNVMSWRAAASMKVPPKRKGNHTIEGFHLISPRASMKVPPKRKGNSTSAAPLYPSTWSLNESPSQKEGKF